MCWPKSMLFLFCIYHTTPIKGNHAYGMANFYWETQKSFSQCCDIKNHQSYFFCLSALHFVYRSLIIIYWVHRLYRMLNMSAIQYFRIINRKPLNKPNSVLDSLLFTHSSPSISRFVCVLVAYSTNACIPVWKRYSSSKSGTRVKYI